MKAVCTLIACVWSISGCAITNHTLVTPYAPSQNWVPSAPRTKSVVWETLQLTPTLRNRTECVGVKKNGYGMDTAYVFTNPNPQTWLTQAAKTEFQIAGLEMNTPEADAPSVSILVDQFFVEPDVGFWGAHLTATTILDVTVNLPRHGKTFQRRFVGEDTSFEMIWSDSDFDDRLLKSAQLAFREAAQETRKLIDREDI